MEFTRDQNSSGVSFSVTASRTLVPWVADGSLIEQPEVIDNQDGTETIRVRVAAGAQGSGEIFLRLELQN